MLEMKSQKQDRSPNGRIFSSISEFSHCTILSVYFFTFAPNCLTAKVKTPFSNKLRVIRGYRNMVANCMKYTISSSIEIYHHKATNAQVAVSHSISLTAGAIAKQKLPIALKDQAVDCFHQIDNSKNYTTSP